MSLEPIEKKIHNKFHPHLQDYELLMIFVKKLILKEQSIGVKVSRTHNNTLNIFVTSASAAGELNIVRQAVLEKINIYCLDKNIEPIKRLNIKQA